MEVHKHPHDVMHKKKWNEYLLEFLMIFFAVFLGFVAENVRDHISDHKREKEYIQSMLQDLQNDTTNLASAINGYEKKDKVFDTTFALYPVLVSEYNPTLINDIRRLRGYPDFVYTDRTIQQLKNSGGMNLIRNQKAANAITAYDIKMRNLNNDMNILIGFFKNYAKSWREIFADSGFIKKVLKQKGGFGDRTKNYLLITDRATLGRFYNELKDFRSGCAYIKDQQRLIKKDAVDLMNLLKKQYHLQ